MLNCENTPAATPTSHRPDWTREMVCPRPTVARRDARRADRSHTYAAKNAGSRGLASSGGKAPTSCAAAAAVRPIINPKSNPATRARRDNCIAPHKRFGRPQRFPSRVASTERVHYHFLTDEHTAATIPASRPVHRRRADPPRRLADRVAHRPPEPHRGAAGGRGSRAGGPL